MPGPFPAPHSREGQGPGNEVDLFTRKLYVIFICTLISSMFLQTHASPFSSPDTNVSQSFVIRGGHVYRNNDLSVKLIFVIVSGPSGVQFRE